VAVVATDLDGDGRPDIATANGLSKDVGVLLNRSTPPTPATSPASPPPGAGGPPAAALQFAGTESVSVEAGRKYTNSPAVQLSVHAPRNAGAVLVANDGGFSDAERRPVAGDGRYSWRLASAGSERLPKTAYVRFVGPEGPSALTLTDDIILDETRPKLLAATASVTGTGRARAAAVKGTRVTLRVRGKDATSGLAGAQATADRRRPGALRALRSTVRITLRGPRIWIRVKDRAGNNSPWSRVTVRSR
jgi:hypothetical protein